MNNYLLKPTHQTATPYRDPDAAMLVGQFGTQAFTVNMVEPEMIVCFWQPGMDKPAYNEYYKTWLNEQYKELGRVSG